MKTNFLTSIVRTAASTLMPSRINVEKDSLAKAISRKSGNHTISRQTADKLLSISNYHALPTTAFEKSDSFTPSTSVQEMKVQLDKVSRQSGRSRQKSRASGEKIDKIVNAIKIRVGFAEDILTQSYWKSRDGDTADMQAQASTAVDRLGFQPEHKDYCLTQQVSRLTQEMHISEQAIIRMRAAFHGIYRIPQRDETNSPPLTFSDFPDPSTLSEFVNLTAAAEDLRDAYNLLPSFHSDAVRGSVERTLKNLDQIMHSARSALLSRYDELVAQPQDATEELNAICSWLGIFDAPNERPVCNDDNSSVSITNAESVQEMDDHPDSVSEADSEDSYITESSSDSETDSIHSFARPDEHPRQAPASQLSSAFDQLMVQSYVSYAELTELTKLFVQESGIPDLHNDTRSPYQIHEFLAQGEHQTPRTIQSLREEMQHIQLRIRSIDSGLVREILQNRHFMFNDMIDRTESLWKQVASERNARGETSPYRALACQWLGLPEMVEPSTQDDAVFESAPSIAARPVNSSPEKPNPIAMFAKAMRVERRPDENIVEYEARSADAVSAVAEAFLNNLGFKLPASDDRKEHLLTDFPDALDMQTFRSIQEMISELGQMRSQLRHVDSVGIKQRLSDRLASLYAITERAEDFWTDRLLELEQRAAAGESVKEDVHIARKWLGAHDPVTVQDVTANSIIGGEAPTDVGMPKAGEIEDAVDDADGGRRLTLQASHLFNQAAAEQTQEKRQKSAASPVSRGYAWMTALR